MKTIEDKINYTKLSLALVLFLLGSVTEYDVTTLIVLGSPLIITLAFLIHYERIKMKMCDEKITLLELQNDENVEDTEDAV